MDKSFTEGKILSPLLRFALPVLLAVFLQTTYGAVDMMIVGLFGTAADVSAVSTGGWLMMAIASTIVGLSMGTTVLLGQKIGEGDQKEAGGVVGTTICLFAVIGVAVTLLMGLLAVPAARAMRIPAEALDGTVQYLRICSAGSVFIVAYNVLGSVFRGMGNSKIPLLSVFVACVLNIGGDLLLVGVFKMGVAGAAIATVAAQLISVVICFLIIRRRSVPFAPKREQLRLDRKRAAAVLRLGAPIALQDLLLSLSFLCITAFANNMGLIRSAGVGVAEKLCGFILVVPAAYMQSMSAFVAQNIGAGRPDRAKKALLCGILTSLGVGVLLAWFSFFHGDLMAGLFARDRDVVLAAAEYLKAYAVDGIMVSALFCLTGYFNGCGRTTFVMLQGVVGAIAVRVPVSYLFSRMRPVSLFRMGLAIPLSTICQLLMCGAYVLLCRRAGRHKSRI